MTVSPTASSVLRIGSRGSPLALVQARQVRDRIAAVAGLDPGRVEIKVIKTTGDIVQDRPLAEAGGKGLFTKEIEAALAAGDIDLAVHSAKDLPTFMPPGLVIAAFLPREDPRDAFIGRKAKSLRDLPPGAVVGTASPRREAFVRRLRPDIDVVPLRGNVETRLRKLEAGDIDATLLAVAGLKRLGLLSAATAIFEPGEFVPAVGQGAIAHRNPGRRRRARGRWPSPSTIPIPKPRWLPSAPFSPCSTAPAGPRSAVTPSCAPVTSASTA